MENVEFIREWAIELPQRYSTWWLQVYEEAPWHIAIETSLIVFILWVVFFKKEYNPEKKGYGGRAPAPLSEKEKQELIDEWTPAPLLEKSPAEGSTEEPVVVVKKLSATKVLVEGDDQPKLDLTSADFLGLGMAPETKDAAIETMDEYTLGSCGPRGFYGTTRKHTELEEEIAGFMGTSEAICYSDAVSCVASAVPAFSKRGDLLICDRGINHALQTGALLSRSKVMWFKHNDVEDLERVIKEAVSRNRRVAATQRRFIVIEGIYKTTGDIAPLAKIAALKKKYKIRILIDESLSWGVLGETGKGATEHAGLEVSDVDVIVGSLAATLGSIGGFCVGNREVTDHQRLAGAGYCFSASAPPFLCATARSALQNMTPELLSTLRERSQQSHAGLTRVRQLKVVSDDASPVAHAQLSLGEGVTMSRTEQEAKLDAIAAKCLEAGVLVHRAKTLPEDTNAPAPSLQVQVTAAMSSDDVDFAMDAIANAAASVLGGTSAARSSSAGAGRGAGAGARSRSRARARGTGRSTTKKAAAAAKPKARARAKQTAPPTALRRSTRRRAVRTQD